MSAPTDQAARDRVITALDETLVVSAGAGTGKTRALVSRIVRLLLVGNVPLRAIAAITFTEAAAAELRDRIRAALETVAATGMIPAAGDGEEPLDLVGRAALVDALQHLDDATITTLHGFAQRILAEHPLEAGLPPRFQVRDEVQSSVAFEAGWSSTLDALLEDVSLEAVTVRALALGLPLSRLRDIARSFHTNWHRTRDWLAGLVNDGPETVPPLALRPVLDAVDAASALTVHNRTADALLERAHQFADLAVRLRAAADDDERVVLLTEPLSSRVGATGNKSNWGGAIDEMREAIAAIGVAIAGALADQRAAVLTVLNRRIASAVVTDAEARRRSGELEFHDLLVFARDLLAGDASVRAALHHRYERILIDEFQDTDPLQIEIATLLAAADPVTAADQPWFATPVEPGRLFVVGDPKQSIYRFRSADIALYARVLDVHADHVVTLHDNFRSSPEVLEHVNAIFPALFAAENEVQVAFEPLVAFRPPAGPAARVLTIGDAYDEPIDEIREREATDLAAAITTALTESWPVQRRLPGGRREAGPARLADITILLPTRTSLPQIEHALDDAGIAYRVESKSLVYSTAEVRDLLAVLATIDDPTDEVALVAALRTPAFACADDDLLAFKQAGGRWDYRFPRAALPADHAVLAAMRALASYYEQRRWLTVSELVDLILRERRFFELALAARRPRDRWRRYRFLADQARAFCSNGGRDLRTFLAWAEGQADERASINEVVAPETDDDAVRILTVHGAKGLEFPIVMLAGLNVGARNESLPVIWTETGCEISIGSLATPGFAAAAARERVMSAAERVRLLYVALTRAEDHLVVSLHRGTRDCDAARLAAVGTGAPARPWTAPAPPPRSPGARPATVAATADGTAVAAATLLARVRWQAGRRHRVAALRRAGVIAATGVADLAEPNNPDEPHGLDAPGPPPVVGPDQDLDDLGWVEAPDPPRRRGRAGTARGRAVHAVLQTVDLATGAGLADAARAQAEAEGIAESAGEVEDLARAALESSVVREAVAATRRWRELALATPVEGVVLEGFVDLLYESAAGLVVVDYKTDRLAADGTEAATQRYRLQLAAYAAALESLLGQPVARAILLFLGDGRPIPVEISDLPGAIAEVRSLLARDARRLAELRHAMTVRD